MYTYYLVQTDISFYYLVFLGSATCLLYSLHRIIGVDKVGDFRATGRFAIIRHYRHHLYLYGAFSAIIVVYAIIHLNISYWVLCVVPAFLSLLYVVPIFSGKKRLRDYSYIKLLLLGFCWMWFVATIPAWGREELGFVSLSRFLFIIGITIPFDLRDREVDASSGVKTIAHLMDDKRAISLACFLLCLSFISIMPVASLSQDLFIIEGVVHLLTVVIVILSYKVRSDYYYSFLMDGTMGFFIITYWLINM